MKQFSIILLLSVSTFFYSCKKDCVEPQQETYSLIKPKEEYQLGFKPIADQDFYVLRSGPEFQDILIRKFRYSGNYFFNGEKDMVIGVGVYIDHIGYEPLIYEVKEYKQKGVIKIEVKAKERFTIIEPRPGFLWIWINIPKSDFKIEKSITYEQAN